MLPYLKIEIKQECVSKIHISLKQTIEVFWFKRRDMPELGYKPSSGE
jgi:hypothetical protein